MMFVTMAEAAETLDTTEAGVEQLMRARVLQPATQLEHAVASGAAFGTYGDGAAVSVRDAPMSRTAQRVAAELGIDERAIQGLCATGKLRQVTDYQHADPRLRVALPLPTVTAEDVARAAQLLAERDEAERLAPPPPDPFLTEVANAINAGTMTAALLERFAAAVPLPRGVTSTPSASEPLPTRRGRRMTTMVEG